MESYYKVLSEVIQSYNLKGSDHWVKTEGVKGDSGQKQEDRLIGDSR